jgi:hypothetical protein
VSITSLLKIIETDRRKSERALPRATRPAVVEQG